MDYAYRESPESCCKPGTGVITYPCCPFCGVRNKIFHNDELVDAPDDKDFKRGFFCSCDCKLAWELKYNPSNLIAALKVELRSRITKNKINCHGDGI